MSYVALATNVFDDVVHFYGVELGMPVETQWDRPRGRGTRFLLGGGLRLEILDNTREPHPLPLAERRDDTHIVIEVDDIHAFRRHLPISTPVPSQVSWGAVLFELRDPSGTPVTVLQWQHPSAPATSRPDSSRVVPS